MADHPLAALAKRIVGQNFAARHDAVESFLLSEIPSLANNRDDFVRMTNWYLETIQSHPPESSLFPLLVRQFEEDKLLYGRGVAATQGKDWGQRRAQFARAAAASTLGDSSTEVRYRGSILGDGETGISEEKLRSETTSIEAFNKELNRREELQRQRLRELDSEIADLTDVLRRSTGAQKKMLEADIALRTQEREEILAEKKSTTVDMFRRWKRFATDERTRGAQASTYDTQRGSDIAPTDEVVSAPARQPRTGPSRMQALKLAAREHTRLSRDAREPASAMQGILLFALIVAVPASVWFGSWLFIMPVAILFFLMCELSRVRDEVGLGGGVVLLVLLLFHGLMVASEFSIGRMWIWIICAGALVTVFWLFFPDSKLGELIGNPVFLAVFLACYTIPGLLSLLSAWVPIPDIARGVIEFVVTFFPPWLFLFLLHGEANDPDGALSKVFTVFKFAILPILVIGLVYAAGNVSDILPPALSLGAQGSSERIQQVIDTLNEWRTDGYRTFVFDLNRTVSQTLNPGAYYTGQVDQSTKKPLGIHITNLRAQDKTITNESPMILYGVVKANSFIGESVWIEPACRFDSKDTVAAFVDPIPMEVIFGSSGAFECTFEPNPQWKRDTYPVVASATFPFETWSYIKYTFVDEERLRAYARQGVDAKQRLGIMETPLAIYSAGPVSVGMGGSTQPIAIAPNDENIVQRGTRIGITVESAWQKGKLRAIDEWQLKLPRPFALDTDGCDRNVSAGPLDDPEDPEYQYYVFKNPTDTPNPTYTSITCPLIIEPQDRDAAQRLVSSGDKVERSFIAVVKYRYTVEEKTTVVVR
jgi:hypothetical protein